MMKGKKMTNIAVAIVCGAWLALAGMAAPLHAETGAAAEQGNVIAPAGQSVDDLLNDELLGEIENDSDEQLNEELLNEIEEGRIETLIYEYYNEEQTTREFFI